MDHIVDKKRIAKNTLFLYIRMFVVLVVNFYAVRLLLELLGIEDYGIYNIVFGIVIMFTMLNGAMSTMVQRFLCYEMGRGNDRNIRQVFTISLLFFAVLAILIIVCAETIGLWFVNNKLNIPVNRLQDARFVYQLSIVAIIAKTFQIPYTSLTISYEKMQFFAKISFLEAGCTLFSVLLLEYIPYDRLTTYAVLQTVSSVLVLAGYFFYCTVAFPCCKGITSFSRSQLSAMSQFFSWSILGAFANICRDQGLNIVLNIFYGVTLNATWALSRKISAAIGQLVSNFQIAFNPQLLKSYTNPNKAGFIELINSSSKYSYLLLFLVVFPVLMKTEFFLRFWLVGEFPPYLDVFVKLTIMGLLVDALCGPMWIAAQADGKIAFYQICVTIIYLFSLSGSFIACKFNLPPYIVPCSVLLTNCIGLLFRMIYLRKVGFSCKKYITETLFPVSMVTVVCLGIWGVVRFCVDHTAFLLLSAIVINPVIIAILGVNKKERAQLLKKFKEKLWNKRKKASV